MSSSCLSNALVSFGTAVMFLTRVPVGRFCSGDPHVLAQSVRLFPLVGLLVALFMSAVFLLTSLVLPVSISVVMALIAGVLFTGAFHEDGLADVADSAGAFGIDKKLQIMRDSRVGTYGSLGLILALLLRFVLLWELAMQSFVLMVAALIAAHGCSRWSSVYLMAKVSYARAEAANKVVALGVDDKALIHASIVLCLVSAIPALLSSIWIFCVLPITWICCMLYKAYFNRTFGGITGDCLGAANVVTEMVCLAVVLMGVDIFLSVS